jgi:hypothetical protein
MCTKFGKDNFVDQGVDGRMMLKWIFEKCGGNWILVQDLWRVLHKRMEFLDHLSSVSCGCCRDCTVEKVM